MQQLNPIQEAKSLNVRLEQDNGEWIAVLPPHPDIKGDSELGFPAPSEQEALDEARAYRAIEQSKVYKFEYDEKRDVYRVAFADQTYSDKYLAPAYRQAQQAYAASINQPEAPAAEPPTPAPAKQRRRRTNGADKIPSDPQFTSGVGQEPGQLPPAAAEPMNAVPWDQRKPWDELEKRLTRLENAMIHIIVASGQALEELRKR